MLKYIFSFVMLVSGLIIDAFENLFISLLCDTSNINSTNLWKPACDAFLHAPDLSVPMFLFGLFGLFLSVLYDRGWFESTRRG